MSTEKPDWQVRFERLDPVAQKDLLEHVDVQTVELLLKHWAIRAFHFPRLFVKHYQICRKTFPVISSLKLGYGWTKAFLFPTANC